MGASPRKDYGAAAVVPLSNPTVKRVMTQNAPFSIQATGHDLVPGKHIPLTSENLDALVTGTRVLDVPQEKYVKAVTSNLGVLTSADIGHRNDKGEEVVKTYTKAELLASTTIFLAKVI